MKRSALATSASLALLIAAPAFADPAMTIKCTRGSGDSFSVNLTGLPPEVAITVMVSPQVVENFDTRGLLTDAKGAAGIKLNVDRRLEVVPTMAVTAFEDKDRNGAPDSHGVVVSGETTPGLCGCLNTIARSSDRLVHAYLAGQRVCDRVQTLDSFVAANARTEKTISRALAQRCNAAHISRVHPCSESVESIAGCLIDTHKAATKSLLEARGCRFQVNW